MSVKFVVFVLNSLGYNYLMSGKSFGILFSWSSYVKLRSKFIERVIICDNLLANKMKIHVLLRL